MNVNDHMTSFHPLPTNAMSWISWCYHIPFLMLLSVLLFSCSEAPQPKNVVVILIDDLGWIDTGIDGSTFYETPAIDQLANEGVRFTQFYAASGVCSPTRASLMTGKSPARLQITNWIGGEQRGMLNQAEYQRSLPLEEVTIGEVFRDAGFSTGYIGKWHLGQEGFMPENQGFDYTHAVNYAGQPGSFFPPYVNPNFAISNVPDLEDDPEDAYLTDRLTDAAIEFLESQKDSSFFLVLSHYAVHTPIQSPPELTAYYEAKLGEEGAESEFIPEGSYGTTRVTQNHPAYAGMIASVDESVRRITTALDSLGLAENTVIVFTSDNGGLSTLSRDRRWAPTANLPLRAGKGFLYEGGIRIPFILRDPSGPHGMIIETPGITNDLLPTLVGVTELYSPLDTDGADLSVLLAGDPLTDRDLHWHFPHYHGSGNRPSGAIRSGGYKLIEWFEDGRVELYNLTDDPGELVDLSEALPDKAEELTQALHSWRESSGANMPSPNPEYEPPTE